MDNKIKLSSFINEIKDLINESKKDIAVTVNSALTMLFWKIGLRINKEIIKGVRAEYGKKVYQTLSSELINEYGRSFSKKNLLHMSKFAEVFNDFEIVSSMSRHLSWTHFRSIIYLNDPLKIDFYAQMCRIENWSTRTLRERIDSMLFERTAISKKPDELITSELKVLRERNGINSNFL